MTTNQDDPIVATRLALTMDGVSLCEFSELSAIDCKLEVAKYYSSTPDGVRVTHVPGIAKGENTVTFKMAMGTNLEMNTWLEAAQAGKMAEARKSVSLLAYTADGKVATKFWLENAWPVACKVSPQRAGGNDIMQQEWTLTYEQIQRVA